MGLMFLDFFWVCVLKMMKMKKEIKNRMNIHQYLWFYFFPLFIFIFLPKNVNLLTELRREYEIARINKVGDEKC